MYAAGRGRRPCRAEASRCQVLISKAAEEPLRRFLACLAGEEAPAPAAAAAAPRQRALAVSARAPGHSARPHEAPPRGRGVTAAGGPCDENSGGNVGAPSAKRPCLASRSGGRALSGAQCHVLEAARAGRSFFFTGSAGTGKSMVLHEIVAVLPPALTAVTASTGAAACAIGAHAMPR